MEYRVAEKPIVHKGDSLSQNFAAENIKLRYSTAYRRMLQIYSTVKCTVFRVDTPNFM
jgi:hypothetical protein